MVASAVPFVVGRNPYVLLAARGLQCVSGSAVGVIGLTLLVETVNKENCAKAFGFSGMANTWAILLGPKIGGFEWAF